MERKSDKKEHRNQKNYEESKFVQTHQKNENEQIFLNESFHKITPGGIVILKKDNTPDRRFKINKNLSNIDVKLETGYDNINNYLSDSEKEDVLDSNKKILTFCKDRNICDNLIKKRQNSSTSSYTANPDKRCLKRIFFNHIEENSDNVEETNFGETEDFQDDFNNSSIFLIDSDRLSDSEKFDQGKISKLLDDFSDLSQKKRLNSSTSSNTANANSRNRKKINIFEEKEKLNSQERFALIKFDVEDPNVNTTSNRISEKKIHPEQLLKQNSSKELIIDEDLTTKSCLIDTNRNILPKIEKIKSEKQLNEISIGDNKKILAELDELFLTLEPEIQKIQASKLEHNFSCILKNIFSEIMNDFSVKADADYDEIESKLKRIELKQDEIIEMIKNPCFKGNGVEVLVKFPK